MASPSVLQRDFFHSSPFLFLFFLFVFRFFLLSALWWEPCSVPSPSPGRAPFLLCPPPTTAPASLASPVPRSGSPAALRIGGNHTFCSFPFFLLFLRFFRMAGLPDQDLDAPALISDQPQPASGGAALLAAAAAVDSAQPEPAPASPAAASERSGAESMQQQPPQPELRNLQPAYPAMPPVLLPVYQAHVPAPYPGVSLRGRGASPRAGAEAALRWLWPVIWGAQ